MAASAGNAMQTFGGMNFSGEDGLSANMGAFMRSPVSNSSPVTDSTDKNLQKFMSAAPQGSNVTQGFAATGMVPQYSFSGIDSLPNVLSTQGMLQQSMVQIERSGDINVMRG